MIEGKLGKTVALEPFLASSIEEKSIGWTLETELSRWGAKSLWKDVTFDCDDTFLQGVTVLGETASSSSYTLDRKLDHDRTLGSRA
jgi:hypothetical protein